MESLTNPYSLSDLLYTYSLRRSTFLIQINLRVKSVEFPEAY